MIEGYGNQGYETCPGPKLEQWLRDAGFQDIKAKKLRIPMGTWPKDKKFVRLVFFQVVSLLLTSDLLWTRKHLGPGT